MSKVFGSLILPVWLWMCASNDSNNSLMLKKEYPVDITIRNFENLSTYQQSCFCIDLCFFQQKLPPTKHQAKGLGTKKKRLYCCPELLSSSSSLNLLAHSIGTLQFLSKVIFRQTCALHPMQREVSSSKDSTHLFIRDLITSPFSIDQIVQC